MSQRNENPTIKEAYPLTAVALDVAPRIQAWIYPDPFAARTKGREKRQLGNLFGLSNFGVNLTRLLPGACSALRHSHTRQDEFIYILSGRPLLISDAGEIPLSPGMCAGFKAGTGNAHQLINRTDTEVLYLEVGDRSAGDCVSYPDDDFQLVTGADGNRQPLHKDGTPY